MTPRERAEKWLENAYDNGDWFDNPDDNDILSLAAEFRTCAADALEAAAERIKPHPGGHRLRQAYAWCESELRRMAAEARRET